MSLEGMPSINEEDIKKEKPAEEMSVEGRIGEKSARDQMREVFHLGLEKEFIPTDADVELAYNKWKEIKDLLPSNLVEPFARKLLRFAFRLAEKEPQLSENEIARALETWSSVLDGVNSEMQKSFARRLVHQIFHLDDKTYEFTEADKALAKRVLGAVSGYVPSSSLIKVYSRKLGI